MTLKRVLVANRGEIAVRVIRACADEGFESVAALSEADLESMPAYLADRTVCLGPGAATESYLDVGRVVTAALGTGSDALHPGYGFLAERPELAEACLEKGITFVGPRPDTIRRGGDKLLARGLANDLGIPVSGGSDAVTTAADAATLAESIGYPVMLKAAAGGGGKGMVLCQHPEALADRFKVASSEARQAFGDGHVYLEHFVTNARHIEVQVLGDTHGNVIHLGDRDCSSQRRYQKLIEETPAPGIDTRLRSELHEAALILANALGYVGAGTVEFIVDLDQDSFSFLEINTRIQVEHPVTEMTTGVDIVREQLRVAGGERLRIRQREVRLQGHAIECRINAESPEHGFRPTPGRLERWLAPQLTNLRVDTHCYPGYLVPLLYDSLLAKFIAWGENRNAALDIMAYALDHLRVEGVSTTAPFHRAIIGHADFAVGQFNTRWVEETFMPGWLSMQAEAPQEVSRS